MLVAAPAGDGFRVLDSFSRIVRLGEGLHRDRPAQPGRDGAGACGALHACAARLARRPVRRLRAIATEACRRAANGTEFLARVKDETGLDIGIISTREEAELALESCAPLLAGWRPAGAAVRHRRRLDRARLGAHRSERTSGS